MASDYTFTERGVDWVWIKHPKVENPARVRPRLLAHYEDKGWRAVSPKSQAVRSANPAPAGADTASNKEGTSS
jgi:hypothetical protein